MKLEKALAVIALLGLGLAGTAPARARVAAPACSAWTRAVAPVAAPGAPALLAQQGGAGPQREYDPASGAGPAAPSAGNPGAQRRAKPGRGHHHKHRHHKKHRKHPEHGRRQP